MNQKGEVTLLAVSLLVALTGIMLLCAMELERSLHLLKKRTKLFLCAKETKGELHNYLVLMGRTNWGLKNLDKAKWVMLFIPGMQGAALDAEKTKKILKAYQDISLIRYLLKLKSITRSGCNLDPRMYLTPYEIASTGHLRNASGSARIRNIKWTQHFVHSPYSLSVQINLMRQEKLKPEIAYEWKERKVKSLSRLSSVY